MITLWSIFRKTENINGNPVLNIKIKKSMRNNPVINIKNKKNERNSCDQYKKLNKKK